MDKIKELEAELQAKEKELAEFSSTIERLENEREKQYRELVKLKAELPKLLVDVALGRVDAKTKNKVKRRIKTLEEEREENFTTQELLREEASDLNKRVPTLPGLIRAAKKRYKQYLKAKEDYQQFYTEARARWEKDAHDINTRTWLDKVRSERNYLKGLAGGLNLSEEAADFMSEVEIHGQL